VNTEQLSLRADASSVYTEHRAEYLAQLVAPMDDMWAAFADMGAPHALMVGDEVAGSCVVDAEGQLIRFYVVPRFQNKSGALLRLALRELKSTQMMVFTNDPNYLSTALDVADSVESHTLLFAQIAETETPGLDGLRVATLEDQQHIVDFEVDAIGAPREFLDYYVGARLERSEIVLLEDGAQIRCVGELRRDDSQKGVSQLGMIVGTEERGQGIGSRMMSELVTRSGGEGLTPYCSTEMTNVGARRAIERAGFRATHRILLVKPLPLS
jgi:GNAT superfamily N-acetyltransferase